MHEGWLNQGSLADIRASARAWMHGWRDGLLSCLPEMLRARMRPHQAKILIQLQDGRAELALDKGGEPVSFGSIGPESVDGLEQVLEQGRRLNAGIVVLLSPADLLLRRISLPVHVKENLARVLELEMDRLTPFSSADLYFDFRLLPNTVREQISVELAVVRRSAVDPWLGTLKDLKASPGVLAWPGAWRDANLLPRDARARKPQAGLWMRRILWTLLGSLVLAVLVTPLWQKRAIAIELLERGAKARIEAEKVSTLRRALETDSKSASYILERKREYRYLVELMRKVTELLPDNSWISQLDYVDGDVQLRGESPQSTALIELLAKEPSFRSISFRSPVVGVPNTDRERFHIGFQFATPKAAP